MLRLFFARIAGARLAIPREVLAVALLALAGCHQVEAPREVLSGRCLSVGNGRDGVVNIIAPADGVLRIRVEERGISVTATLDGDPKTTTASPTERVGTLVLTTSTHRARNHSVRVRAEDSPDISGIYCVDAQLIAPAQVARLQAEQAFAAAGRATHEHDWDHAFGEYLDASRRYASLGLRRSSGISLQAMAEIAYLRLDRKRDSFALANAALAAVGTADPLLVGALVGLEGKALLDIPGMAPNDVAARVRSLLSIARRYDGASQFGARELPRLDIMSGFLEYMLDAPAKSREVFAVAAQRCGDLRDWDCYAIAKQNLAELALETNNYSAAMTAYADALRALPPDLDPKLSADIWINYGHIQGFAGLFSESERSQENARRQYARLGDCPGIRRSLSWSGSLMVQIGTLSDAKDSLQQAASRGCSDLLAGIDEAARPASMTSSRQRTAGTKSEQRTEFCARPIAPETLAIDNKMTVFNALLSLGETLLLEGESVQARRCIDAAGRYAATARSQMRLANARGSLLLESNDARGAKEAFERSLRTADAAKVPAMHVDRGIAQLGLLKTALLAGKDSDAVKLGTQALQSSMARGDIDQTVTSLRLLASGYRRANDFSQSASTLETAARVIEGIPIDELDGEKRAIFLATQYKVFAELTDLYASQSANNAAMAWLAFATSERGRARSLRYAINQQTEEASSPTKTATDTQYQKLLREVVSLSTQDSGRNLTEQLDGVVRRESGQMPLDQAQLTRALQQLDATLVEYVTGDSDLFAIVVHDAQVSVVRLGGRREIAEAAAALQDGLRDHETPASDTRASAQRLARLVLWPLTGSLTTRRVLIVPDDALHTIPFNVLPWSPSSQDQLVLQHAEVSVLPSALFLTRIQARAPIHTSAPQIELLGDPVFRTLDWRNRCEGAQSPTPGVVNRNFGDWTEALPSLPGSRTEVQSIAKLFRQSRPASRVETLLGCAAVPSALRRAATEHIDLLHIATHARVDAQRPRLSALALTPERANDRTSSAFGLLDILQLKLSSGLVVLSACETSRGRLLPGEGVLGPAQAFLQAGASTVLASYWRVDDPATAEFMQRFYKYLLLEHLPAAAALHRAQLEAAASSNSFDWAAFALYGWPDSSL